jgi:hypothetical protein
VSKREYSFAVIFFCRQGIGVVTEAFVIPVKGLGASCHTTLRNKDENGTSLVRGVLVRWVFVPHEGEPPHVVSLLVRPDCYLKAMSGREGGIAARIN